MAQQGQGQVVLVGQQELRGHRDLVGLAEQRDLLDPQGLWVRVGRVAQQVGLGHLVRQAQ